MKKIALASLLLTTQAYAIRTEFSGNIEGQYRDTRNNSEAKQDLNQKWDHENFKLLYGNINNRTEFDNNTALEVNWFGRYTNSDLYKNNYTAPMIFTFPRKLVARDLFQLQHKTQTATDTTETTLNKFFYEMDSDDSSWIVGRMYINYGQGEIFNPINPFNQPTGLTSIQQVAQGNDGGEARFYLSDKHTVEFYLLGDKQLTQYNHQLSKTLWVHGEYQATDKLQLDYVGGEDQRRHKAGGQASYRLEEAMIFGQALFQSRRIDDEESQNLWDVMLGFDQQFTSKWHFRFEGGHQKRDRFASLMNFSDRFLPSEYFVAISNQVEVHPLVKVNVTLINDIKSGFNYGILKSTFDLGHNMEAEIFGYTPVGKGDSADQPAQKLVTSDIGLALRAFF